jgi:diadenylate cyclase
LLEQLRFFTWQDVLLAIVDIAVVAYLFYKIFTIIRGTRAVQLLKGVAFLFVLVSVTQWARLYTINWILVQVRTMLLVALPIVFQPELRRGLEQIGRGRLFSRTLFRFQEHDVEKIVEELVAACFSLSAQRTGGLIVLERETGLEEYMEDAVRIDGFVTSQLIENIFVYGSPLHDGAVIIRGDRVAAAASFLPPTQDPVTVELGSRHRAALGITQVSDAVAIVISEETGTVSLASGGRLIRGLDAKTLREKLLEALGVQGAGYISSRRLWK